MHHTFSTAGCRGFFFFFFLIHVTMSSKRSFPVHANIWGRASHLGKIPDYAHCIGNEKTNRRHHLPSRTSHLFSTFANLSEKKQNFFSMFPVSQTQPPNEAVAVEFFTEEVPAWESEIVNCDSLLVLNIQHVTRSVSHIPLCSHKSLLIICI